MVNNDKRRESPEALMEVFGTPNPNPQTVARWKRGWQYTKGKIKVKNFNSAVKLLTESDIDPLFYQFYATPPADYNGHGEPSEQFYVVFYKEEHEVFFKLHAGMA